MKRLALVAAFAAGFFLARARTSADPPNISRFACEVDTDCVIVTSVPTCDACGGCVGARTSVARRFLEARTRACRAPQRPVSRPSTCPPCPNVVEDPAPLEAVCRESMCTLRNVPSTTPN